MYNIFVWILILQIIHGIRLSMDAKLPYSVDNHTVHCIIEYDKIHINNNTNIMILCIMLICIKNLKNFVYMIYIYILINIII